MEECNQRLARFLEKHTKRPLTLGVGELGCSEAVYDTHIRGSSKVLVSGAGLKTIDGEYVLHIERNEMPQWKQVGGSGLLMYWSTGCGWELYAKYGSTTTYWCNNARKNSWPWKLASGVHWSVRPGGDGLKPPPRFRLSLDFGDWKEQQQLEEFLIDTLRLPKALAKEHWLFVRYIVG